ncbi:hypothetical protein GO988_20645 [Hymenobacter sp. HMF4947]|uniref:Tetratricopeptide repeat protein n=1 Tax=Hymenobacter ginkgonis TaxID=2682976 RepID=A0A7K1TK21_9BACT|nr:hypothetical protein [Hymenobacter ginkgonis]MVN78749.1 hypothetical protein [Hymenobacter ginkgonis]
MPISTFYRTTLFAFGAGLLSIVGAQAQNSPAGAKTLMANSDAFALASPSSQPTAEPATEAAVNLSTPPPPEASASFYDDSHKDLSPALAWMQETNSIAPTYWNLYTESRIRLKMKDYHGARTVAEQAYKLAVKAMPVSKEYVLLSANMVAQAHLLAQK